MVGDAVHLATLLGARVVPRGGRLYNQHRRRGAVHLESARGWCSLLSSPSLAVEPRDGFGASVFRWAMAQLGCWGCAGAVAALAVATYLWWLPNYFVADDWVLLGSISQPDWNLAALLPFQQLPHRINSTDYYAPVLAAVLWFAFKLGGFSPERYHLLLLLFHVGTVLFLFAATLHLTGCRLKATAAGAIFAVHFASTEAVGWIGGATHVVAAFFGIAALAFYARHLSAQRTWWQVAALLALICASLVQVTALPWFAILACLDLLHSRMKGSFQGMGRRLAVLGLLLLALAPLQHQALRFSGTDGYQYQMGPWAVRNLFFYPVSTVMPSLEGPSFSLTRDLVLASVDGEAFIRLMGMADAFSMLLAAGLVIAGAALLWSRGGWVARLSVLSFLLATTPFLLLNGHGYRYLYMPLLFFSLAAANSLVDLYRHLTPRSRLSALAVLSIIPLFVVLSFAESQRQLFWWQQAGFVAHNSLQQLRDLHPTLPQGAKVVLGGLPDTLQNSNAQVWRNGIAEAVRTVYADGSLRVEAYTREEVERLFRDELKGAPNSYGMVWDNWRLRQIAP